MKRRAKEVIAKCSFIACAVYSVAAIIAITVYLFVAGIPGLAQAGFFRALFGFGWAPASDKFGLFPMILATLYITAGAIVIGGIIGVFASVFIARFCPKKLKPTVKQAVNLLSALPSVIYGAFGMAVLVPFLRDAAIAAGASDATTGFGILASSIVLGIMILPTVINLAVNALEAQPQSYFEGALALGATREQATFKVLFPAAKPGILSGIILGIGRALGETMAVVMVCGGAPAMPEGLFGSVRTLTANIVTEMGYAGGLQKQMLLSSALVLLVFVFMLTLCLNLLRRSRK